MHANCVLLLVLSHDVPVSWPRFAWCYDVHFGHFGLRLRLSPKLSARPFAVTHYEVDCFWIIVAEVRRWCFSFAEVQVLSRVQSSCAPANGCLATLAYSELAGQRVRPLRGRLAYFHFALNHFVLVASSTHEVIYVFQFFNTGQSS